MSPGADGTLQDQLGELEQSLEALQERAQRIQAALAGGLASQALVPEADSSSRVPAASSAHDELASRSDTGSLHP